MCPSRGVGLDKLIVIPIKEHKGAIFKKYKVELSSAWKGGQHMVGDKNKFCQKMKVFLSAHGGKKKDVYVRALCMCAC